MAQVGHDHSKRGMATANGLTGLPPIGAPEDAPTETGPGDPKFEFPVFMFSPQVAALSVV